MAASFDLGSGRIDGFFTNGRAELVEFVDRALAPVAGLGPFTQVNEPVVGTDNFDFMLEGVANLVASQESANYGPNYHARSDTFEEVDLRQMRANAAVAAALTWAFADGEETWDRHDRPTLTPAEAQALSPHQPRLTRRIQIERGGALGTTEVAEALHVLSDPL